MPEYVVVFSDMQFNQAISNADDTALKMIDDQYKEAGYTRPNIIFWNLVGSYDNTPVRFDDNGTALVSGYSPALLKAVLSADLTDFTPENVMLEAIMKSRYDI